MRNLLLVLIFLTAAQAAHACGCSGPGSPDDPESTVSRYADVIFVGEVIAVGERQKDKYGSHQVIRFKPVKFIKGKQPKVIEIWIGEGGNSCDLEHLEFQVGDRYLMSGNLYVGQQVDLALTRYHNNFCSLHEQVDPDTLKPLKSVPYSRPHPEWGHEH